MPGFALWRVMLAAPLLPGWSGHGPDSPESSRPGLQLPVVFGADRDGRGAQAGAERVDRHRGVDVLAGVDADHGPGGDGLARRGGLQAGCGP